MIDEPVRPKSLDVAVSRNWSHAALVSCSSVGLVLIALSVVWPTEMTSGFLAGVGIVLVVELVVFLRTIHRAHHEAGPQRLTLATWITIHRGAALALLAGFLAVDAASGTLAWVPATLFAIAASLDAVDGYVARATDAVTELGERLDVELDALTVLVGVLVAIAAGGAPVAFIAVGIARYLFVFGIWTRRRLGLAVYELPRSQVRRVLGAGTMVAIWFTLLPVLEEPHTRMLVTIVMIPFLLNFTRDWLAISRGPR